MCAVQDTTTPLFVAAVGGHADAVRVLIEAGAEVNVKCGDATNVRESLFPPLLYAFKIEVFFSGLLGVKGGVV